MNDDDQEKPIRAEIEAAILDAGNVVRLAALRTQRDNPTKPTPADIEAAILDSGNWFAADEPFPGALWFCDLIDPHGREVDTLEAYAALTARRAMAQAWVAHWSPARPILAGSVPLEVPDGWKFRLYPPYTRAELAEEFGEDEEDIEDEAYVEVEGSDEETRRQRYSDHAAYLNAKFEAPRLAGERAKERVEASAGEASADASRASQLAALRARFRPTDA